MKSTGHIGALADRDRLMVVGKTGTGKSTWCKRHLERELAAGRRVLWADFCDEYSVRAEASPRVAQGPLRDRVLFEDLLDTPDLVSAPDLSLAVVLSRDPREAAEQVGELIELAEAEGELLFGADEVGMFSAYCGDRLHYLAAQSRHWGVPVILASQAMVDVPAKARRQATQLVSFLQTHPADLDAIRELTGSPDFAEEVSRLSLGKHKHWRDSLGPPPGKEK